MTELIALRALLFAGELLAGSAVILSLAWGLAAQRSASARHLTWAAAFGALLALPVLMAIFPSAFHLLLPAPPRLPLTRSIDVVEMAALPVLQPGGFSLDAPNIALALGALWVVGVCAAAARLTVAAFCLSALRRRSRLFALPPQALPKVAATHRECELRISEKDVGPIAWGLFRPVILLPEGATVWPRDRLHSVLLHELAHIRRRDWAVQALSHLVCALYWPNPLVWIGAKSLRREAEIAADDAVIVSGVRPSSYAGELLQLASEFRVRRPPVLANMALFMAEPSALGARVESVLAPTSLRTGVRPMDVLKIAAAGLFATAAIAFACPSLAQDAQPAPVTAPPLPPLPSDAPRPPDAPPAPEAPPAPPAPPAQPVDVEAPAMQHIHVHLDSRELQKLKHIDLRRMHVAVERAKREAREAIRSARPEIERAVREAHVSEDAMRAVEAAQPEIDKAVAEAMKARPEIDQAWAKARPEVDRALAEARAELAKAHVDAKIEARVDNALKRAEIRIDAAESRDHDRESRREQRSEGSDTMDTRDTPDTPDTPDEN